MKNKTFRWFYLLSLVGVIAAGCWPLVMGVRVVRDMIVQGTVMSEEYPKYIIPYLPITLAVLLGVVLMPLFLRLWGKYAQACASGIALATFFTSELLLEKLVIVTGTVMAKLESWQMFMCYVPAEWYETRTWSPIDVLIGEYSPTFKIHFYAIAIVLILSMLNCFYGFGHIASGEGGERKRALILQSVSTGLFLGLCILACFTAFWRTGELLVSPLSASLMCLFFMTLGVTMGIYVGSLLLRHTRAVCLTTAGVVASATVLLMYVGEMCLLHRHLYRFGTAFLFRGMGALVLAPVDLLVILAPGLLTWLILRVEYRRENK
jgi:hypothetical protein